MNVLCIVDWDHQRSVVDYSRKFKGRQSIENPWLVGCNIENEGTLITNSEKKEKQIMKLFELIWEKVKWKIPKFLQITIVDEEKHLVQSASRARAV